MEFFFSGEIEGDVYDKFSTIQNNIKAIIKKYLIENNYGNAVKEIAIIPTIFSPKTYKVLSYKERKRYSPKTKEAEFRLKIDYKKFKKADDEGKKMLILENILESIRILKTKVKKDFDGDRLENDIKQLFNLN